MLTRRLMSGDGCRCYCGYHGHFDFPQSILLWHQHTHSLGCQHEPLSLICILLMLLSLCIPGAHFPVLVAFDTHQNLVTKGGSWSQVKRKTPLISIDLFLFLCGGEVHGTRYHRGSFPSINIGSGFHCLRSLSFLFFTTMLLPY